MDAGDMGRRLFPPVLRRAAALAVLGVLAAVVPAVPGAGETSAAAACRQDAFRDLDGDGCAEPIVRAGDVRMQFVHRHTPSRITVVSMVLNAPTDAAVDPGCKPDCRIEVSDDGGRRIEITFRRSHFDRGDMVGVRIWSEGYVGRYFGYLIGTKRPKYIACLLRSFDGPPKRCHR